MKSPKVQGCQKASTREEEEGACMMRTVMTATELGAWEGRKLHLSLSFSSEIVKIRGTPLMKVPLGTAEQNENGKDRLILGVKTELTLWSEKDRKYYLTSQTFTIACPSATSNETSTPKPEMGKHPDCCGHYW